MDIQVVFADADGPFARAELLSETLPDRFDGTQYIAVQSGWGVDAQRIQDGLAALNIGFDPDVPQGGVVWVFAVK